MASVEIVLHGSTLIVDPEVIRVRPGDEIVWQTPQDLTWIVLFPDGKSPLARQRPVLSGRKNEQVRDGIARGEDLNDRYGNRPLVIKYSVIAQRDGSDQPIVRDPIIVIRDV